MFPVLVAPFVGWIRPDSAFFARAPFGPGGLVFFFSCVCLMASMARSVNCLGQKNAVQVHLIGAKPIVQVKT